MSAAMLGCMPIVMSPFALLDRPGGGAYLFTDLLRAIPVPSGASPEAALNEASCLADAGHGVVVALDYELGHAYEPAAADDRPGTGWIWIFAERRELDTPSLTRFLDEQAGLPPRPATIADLVPDISAEGHAAAVARIRDYIAAGDCYQVNYTFFLRGRLCGDAAALYARLRSAQPVTHGGLIVTPQRVLLSFSPELFVERTDGVLRARPMKGTAARAADSTADAAARAALAASAKDRAENVMIVDLIRNDLGRIADPGSVSVESLCAIEDYPSVFQMTSTVRAQSTEPVSTVMAALFPCGSITGAPKVRAMQIIRELEAGPRGIYTGGIGWIGAGGDFSLNVAIRTVTLADTGAVSFGAGSGIVWDSRAQDEYRECLLKARFLRAADPGFLLIETLRLEGGVYPLLSGHLRRLHASAASFGFDATDAEGALSMLAASHPEGLWRVRLTLSHAGVVETTIASLGVTCENSRTYISAERLCADDPWLRHKTTVRARYDAALQSLTATPDVFDLIFLNERGEVCEGARSNVFIRRASDGVLLTPPVSSGLLPGVLRQHLLASGQAVEAVLYPADLEAAVEVFLGNALRGLIPVELIAG